MDLMSDDLVDAFGILVAEAIERLVDSHDESLDKRASLQSVETPTINRLEDGFIFQFKISASRQPVQSVNLVIKPDEDGDDVDFEHPVFEKTLQAQGVCECDANKKDGSCCHTLAAAWWLQEQISRYGASSVLEMLSDLESDPVAAGRELVQKVLAIADHAAKPVLAPPTRIQWRIAMGNSRYHSPITITAYEQRPRKSGKGWTKGRQVPTFELANRDFSSSPVDGEIAGMAMNPSYSFDDDHFTEFLALKRLVGHPNVAWDDGEASNVSVFNAQLVLSLQPAQQESEEPPEPGQEQEAYFRPALEIADVEIDLSECMVLKGQTNPVQPIIVVADSKYNRIILCDLQDVRSAKLIEYLLKSDLHDVLLDRETAGRMSVGSARVDSLVRVNLPEQLAGPIQPANAELVFELRPRPGAGLSVALVMHDDRFREVLTPGYAPGIVPCFTDAGPVRLERNLSEEQQRADKVVEKFELTKLSHDDAYKWVVETDNGALDLLARLYDGGEETPRVIWPEGETLRVRGEITPGALRVQIDDRKDWFGLNGVVSLDGKDVKLSDLLAAVRDQRALVQVGDREFAKISDAFRKRLQQLGDAVVNERGSLRVADAAVPAVQDLIGEDVSLEATARWHKSIEQLESLADWTPEKPETLEATLRDYQLEGYQWLARLSRWGVGGVLADDMGLGKTVQTLGVLVDRAVDGPALVIAPTSVGDNWVRETERFAPELTAKLYRDSDRDALIQSAGPGDLIIASYQLVQRDAKRFTSRSWGTLVLDEAQFIKNSQTKTSQAIRKIEAEWRIGLSGTPLENHLGELWSLFRTLSPGLLGSWERFRKKFAEPIEKMKDDERRLSLARLVRPFILRRTKDKVLSELPPRTEITVQAVMSAEEERRYQEARLAAVAELSGAVEEGKAGQQRMKTLAWLTKLRQLACHPRLVDPTWSKGSAKLDLFLSLVDELREGDHRALVFSQFVKHLTVIRNALDEKGITYQYLDGSTPAKERARRVDAFQAGEGELFLISLKAGGTGLNLTAADYVLHLDPWWNPAVEDQATDRAHRIGQERPVTVYRLVAKGTIEEQILEMHADKRELVSGVLEGTDTAGRVNTDELIKMIRQGATEA